ncbi:PKD domain-containing protein [Epilithonimonas sp.]|uniref:DUF7619 domain-containing protein n=1 Tax=Epilithonimonas sp. TaxID=2894511 RepID=UPI0035B1021D
MRNKLFLLALTLISLGVSSQNISFSDANFKAAILVADVSNEIAKDLNGNSLKIDANNDGEIQVAEAQQVGYLNLYGYTQNISSFQDVLNFINIKDLKIYIYNNPTTSININGLAKLEYLKCAAGFNLTSIIVKDCPAMKELFIGGNTVLTSLDIQNLPQLSTLTIDGNNVLKTLEIKNFPALKSVICTSNAILDSFTFANSPLVEDVTVKSNGYLITLDLDELSSLKKLTLFGLDQIKNLNINNCTQLEELYVSDTYIVNNSNISGLVNLKKLILGDGIANVNSLDFSMFTKLESLGCNNLSSSFKLNSINLTGLKNLVDLNCAGNNLTNLDLKGLNNLKDLDCSDNQLVSLNFADGYSQSLNTLNIGGNPNLTSICKDENDILPDTGNVAQNDCTSNELGFDLQFRSALLTSDVNNNVAKDLNGNPLKIDANGDGDIQASEAEQVSEIFFGMASENDPFPPLFSSIKGVLNFTNLKNLQIWLKTVDVVDLHGLAKLENVSITNNGSDYGTYSDFSSSYNFNDCTALKNITINGQRFNELNLNNVNNIENFYINSNIIYTYNGNGFFSKPTLPIIDFSKFTQLKSLSITHFSIPYELNLSGFQYLQSVNLASSDCSLLNVSDNNNLETLNIGGQYYFNGVFEFDTRSSINAIAHNMPKLKNIYFGNGEYEFEKYASDDTLDIKNVPLLQTIDAQIINLKADNCEGLNSIKAKNFTGFDVKNCPTLKSIKGHMSLQSLDFTNSNTPNIQKIDVTGYGPRYNAMGDLIAYYQGGLQTVNVQTLEKLSDLYCSDNQIESLFLKNGSKQVVSLNKNYTLKYICADDEEIPYLISGIATMGLTGVNINSYCTFTPGGNFNTITGTVKIDADNNGCDANDNPFEYLKLKISDGTNSNSGETFVQNNGKYEFYTQTGNYTVTAQAENPALFTISPASFSANFADNNNNVSTQDICVTANGSQNDAEVVIAPLTNARPGFDASYNLVWRNKGNTVLSGKVVLNYDSNKMVFKSSALPYSVISSGSIEFDYANLKPYENRAAEITFTINTPTDANNPVNGGDVLAFNSHITPSNPDLTPNDNYFSFNHTVVNSFDPNDIVCLQGETIPSTAVGKYLNYVVNFENTGSAEAENVVVKMEIDPSEFDINTLQLMNSSAPVETIINGNNAEFKFSKIKLPTGGHGGILLKMKSNATLVEGDSVNNQADIYFDYNFPVETNDYVTTIKDTNNILAAKISYNASAFSQNNYPVNFDASFSTGNITNYQWEFSGNPSVSSSTDVSPVVTYSVPGNYSAKLTVFDASNASSSQIINFNVGNSIANLSTGKDSDNNTIAIDSDEDDWIGYDINGTPITPKVRHTYPGWSYADLGNGVGSQWITLNNFEGYYTYKSKAFTIPENATDATLNLRSLSFVRNWTSLVKVNPDGSETETEITKTSWMSDGFKGWLNSRSPKVDNYSLSPGTYYIKVLLYSNNGNVRESLDVNAVVSCSAGLIYSNKLAKKQPTLQVQETDGSKIKVFPVPVKESVNIISKDKIHSVEIYDSSGRIVYKKILNAAKEAHVDFKATEGIYYLKIKTDIETITRKIIKE